MVNDEAIIGAGIRGSCGFLNPNPCGDQSHGSCLHGIHLALGRVKAHYRRWNASTMNLCCNF